MSGKNSAKASSISFRQNRLLLSNSVKDRIFLITILAPAFILLCFTIFIPIMKSVYMSFFDITLTNIKSAAWNNFANYRDVFSTGDFGTALKNTVFYASSVVVIQFILSMALAMILNMNIPGRKLLRTLVLIPWIVPTIVVALLWMWIFQPQYGVMNHILMGTGIINEPKTWLSDLKLAMPSVMIAALWRQLPFMTIMLLSGMQGIPEDMYEAAVIDGANKKQMFFHITLPFLANVIKTVTLVAVIENFKMFPLFWIMTGGGPVMATTTLAILSYQTAFTSLNLGKGAAIGVLWLLILILFSWGYNKLFSLRED